MKRTLTAIAAAAAIAVAAPAAHAADAKVERGKYLVTFGGCSDCHTPGNFLGHPDFSRYLGGSDVGFTIPGLGTFVGANLTPDKDTGLGKWTDKQIATALTTGVTPEGRKLSPNMPYRDYAKLSKSDVAAIIAYLRTLTPVNHQVAGPFGPGQPVTVFVMTVLPADVYNGMPKPPPGPPPAPPAK